MSPWKVILATLVIFGCGLVTGALLLKTQALRSEVVQSGSSGRSGNIFGVGAIGGADFMRQADSKLHLTPAQHDEIVRIIRDSQDRTKAIRDKIQPSLKTEMDHARAAIYAVLTPEQQTQWEPLMESRNHRPDGRGPRRGDPYHDGTNRGGTNFQGYGGTNGLGGRGGRRRPENTNVPVINPIEPPMTNAP